MKNKPKYFKYILLVVFAMVSLWALVCSYRWGMASAWYFNASYYLDDWAKKGKIEHNDDYINALTAINKAIDYNPKHPHYFHVKGRIIGWGIYSGLEHKLTLKNIKSNYLTSLSFRQAWPIVWIDLASVNDQLHGLNKNTQAYIDKALFYGPYQQNVTHQTLLILMQHWSQLNTEQIVLFYQQLSIALKQPRLSTKIFNEAKAYKLDHLLCIQIKYNDEFKHNRNAWYYKKYCLN